MRLTFIFGDINGAPHDCGNRHPVWQHAKGQPEKTLSINQRYHKACRALGEALELHRQHTV